MNTEDFDILKTGIDYLDNAATTMKPKSVIKAVTDYYKEYTSNIHRGDYNNSIRADKEYETTREKIREFINAQSKEEIIYTNGTTNGLNIVVFGFMQHYLKPGDEVIIDQAEHASNSLPWIVLSKKIGFKLVFAPLDKDYKLTVESIKNCITPNTKVISIAHITNTIGDTRDINNIGKLCKENNILFVVDAAQSIAHTKIDVQEDNINFLAFSGHKMYGPTGTGILYGKKFLLEKIQPIEYGGDMNTEFSSTGDYSLKELPTRLEAGTRNIAGVIGLGAAIDYINSIGLEKIHNYEISLHQYLLEQMKQIPNIKIYNPSTQGTIVLFNVDKYFSQDVAIYLNQLNICIRAGNHCAKMLHEVIQDNSTCRISLSFYNTKEDIDKVVEALRNQDKILDTLV
ncbi:cysteine desulfurase [bacterium]|nr:cysteine desulfurase [bacterium]